MATVPTIEQETDYRLQTIAQLYDSGETHLTGKAIRESGTGAFVGRHGGFKPSFPELRDVPDSPKAIRQAIGRGSGKVFDRVYSSVRRRVEFEREDVWPEDWPAPKKKRSRGRLTVAPHEGRPYCSHCREHHTKGEHRFHGKGSFHRTHLFAFGGNPMTVSEARRTFAELMQRSREKGGLSIEEKKLLQRASQMIRYNKRKTAAHNPAGKTESLIKFLRSKGFMVDSHTSKTVLAQLAKVHRKEFEQWQRGRSLFDAPGPLLKNRRRARKNPAGKLIRMGKTVELRYKRDFGRVPGYYKHEFKSEPVLYYDPQKNWIIIKGR